MSKKKISRFAIKFPSKEARERHRKLVTGTNEIAPSDQLIGGELGERHLVRKPTAKLIPKERRKS